MIRNFENIKSWEDKTGNTYKFGDRKLASPYFFIFAPHFSAFTMNKLQSFPFESFTLSSFEKMFGSWYPELVQSCLYGNP